MAFLPMESGGSNSDYFFLNNMQSVTYSAPNNTSSITFTVPSNDCYIVYGTAYTVNNGISVRAKNATSFSPSTGIEPIFEAVKTNNNLIGLYHCKGMSGQSLTINCNLTVYRCSVTVYY